MRNDNARFGKDCYEAPSFWMGQVLVRPSRQNFAANLVDIMDEKKISAAELAKKIGKTRGAISRWRDGSQEPSFEDKDKIAEALGVPVSRLYLDLTDSRTTKVSPKLAWKILGEALKTTIEKDD